MPSLTAAPSRLARRGGVKRISGQIYDDTRLVLKTYLTQVCCVCRLARLPY